MPYELNWDADVGLHSNGVVFTYSGDVNSDELLLSNQEVYAHPQFMDLRYQIVDFRAVEGFDCNTTVIRRIAKMDEAAAQRNTQICVVAIATSSLVYGYFRMYSMECDSAWPVGIVATWDEALAWLRENGAHL